ncbi:glutathione S-transferase [Gorgonomyces haynaldii]|nr:glutathione S-transferase [Gorgonomyces haynaldii]
MLTLARARLMMIEKNITLEHKTLNIVAGECLEPEFVRVNPKAALPVLVDGEKTISESKDIVWYFDNLDGKPLGPDADRQLVKQWFDKTAEWDGNCFIRAKAPKAAQGFFQQMANLMRKICESRLKEHKDDPFLAKAYQDKINVIDANHMGDPEHQRKTIEDLETILNDAEKQLQKTSYLAGEQYTVADVLMTPLLYRVGLAGQLDLALKERPSVKSYYERMKQRPSFQKTFSATFSQKVPVLDMMPFVWKSLYGSITGRY